jgi:membrane protein implicated in regulation of membrane protease activity
MESLWVLLAAWAVIGVVAVLGFARVLRRTELREERAPASHR